METLIIVFLLSLLGVGLFLLFKIVKWVVAKRARVFTVFSLLLIGALCYTINHLFFKKMEFIQSKVYPNLFLVKNEIKDRDSLNSIIKKMVVEKIDEDFISNVRKHTENTQQAPYAALAFYTYNKNFNLSLFQDYGTAYFIEDPEDLGGMNVESLGMYQKQKLATLNIQRYKNDKTLYYGILDYYKDAYIVKTDTLQISIPIEKTTETDPIPSEFESPLRANEKLKLGTVYTDTVTYVDVNNYDYDQVLLTVKTNNDTIVLISKEKWEENYFTGNEISIDWKIDSLRPAGDPEFLNFTEFIISAKRIDQLKLEESELSPNVNTKNSFVISCGSGCAMTYTEHKIVANNDSSEVTFKIEMFVNEVLSNTYYETYSYTCNPLNNDAEIQLKDDDDYDIENQHPEMQQKLRMYIQQICKD